MPTTPSPGFVPARLRMVSDPLPWPLPMGPSLPTLQLTCSPRPPPDQALSHPPQLKKVGSLKASASTLSPRPGDQELRTMWGLMEPGVGFADMSST